MRGQDVCNFLVILESAGFVYWISGGWGVDALLEDETRAHQDLDIAIDKRQYEAIVASLRARGFRISIDWFPVRVEMMSPDGLRFDLHPLEIAEDGSGRQAGLHGTWYDYPADQFTTGMIDGKVVPCIDRELQLTFHEGYAPREVDLLDIARLEAFRP